VSTIVTTISPFKIRSKTRGSQEEKQKTIKYAGKQAARTFRLADILVQDKKKGVLMQLEDIIEPHF